MSEDFGPAVDNYLKVPDPKPAPITPTSALKLSVTGAMDAKPDYEAELRRAAATTGVPLDSARADPKLAFDRTKTAQLDLDGLSFRSPNTAGFMTNPGNARIAHDDVSTLEKVESTLHNLKLLGASSFWGAVQGGAGYLQGTAPFMRSLGITNPIGGEFDDPKSEMGQALTSLRKGAKATSDFYMPKTDNPWAAGVNSGIVSLMQNAPMTAGAVLTKNPGMALGAMGALTGGQAYGDAKDAGKDDATAIRYGGIQGAIEMLTEKIPLHQLLGDVEKGTGFFKTMAKNVALEAPGEEIATLTQDFNEWATLHPDKPFSDYMSQRGDAAISTLVGVLVGSAGHVTVAKLAHTASTMGEKEGKATMAAQQGVLLNQLNEAAKASKLRARDPQTFHDFVAAATEDGPVDHVFIDPRAITNALAQGDATSVADGAALLQSMPSVMPQMDEALKTGGDVKIPTAEFAAFAAGSDLATAMIPHLKTDPNGMSMAEGEAFMQSHAEEIRAQVQQTMKEAEADDATKVSSAAVNASIMGQLTEANRFTPDVNEAYAHMTTAFYTTLAQRLGVTPEEAMAQHPVQIAAAGVTEGALAQPGEAEPVAAAQPKPATQTPAFKKWFGKSTTHEDGEPVVYYHGTRSDFETFDRVDGGNAYGDGHYFTTDPQQASNYAVGEGVNRITLPGDAHPNVMPVYLKIDKPLDISQHGSNAPNMHHTEVTALENAANEVEPGTFKPRELVDAFDWRGRGYTPTASNVYQWLGEQGLDANEVVRKAGYDGLHTDHGTVVFDAKQIKSAIGNDGTFNPESPSLLRQSTDKAPRGSFDPNTNLITLLKGADLSTFLHESGHFYLETLARVAASNPQNAELNDDMAEALKFMGQGDMTAAEWLAQPLDARREGHETFARGFEAYLLEGKAPSEGLRAVFQRFRSWLAMIYQSVAGLRVSLTDDVRGVFDRMLASHQEIERQEQDRGFQPLFKNAADAGMSKDEFEAYQRLGAEATENAADQLQTRSIRDMKWLSGARDRMVRQLQREANSKRKAMRAEVTAEVMAEPVNRARQFLKFGLLDGQEHDGPTKLSLAELKDMYPGNAQYPGGSIDYKSLGFGKYGMVAEDGLHPEQVAELFGYSSGDELVRALVTTEPAKAAIEGLTDQRMMERYGDLVDKDSLNAAADEALHNDARLKFVATEANALAKAVGKTRILASAAKAFASDLIGRQRVRDLQPSRYTAAEQRAAVAAAKEAAKGNLVGAATEKRNQLVNGYAAKAAMEAKADVEKIVRYFAKFANANGRLKLDADYRDQIDNLLARFDFNKSVTLKALDKRTSLAKWLAAREADNLPVPDLDDDLLNEAHTTSYKNMTVDELRALRDAVASIEHLGRLKHRLLTAKDQRDFQTVVEANAAEVVENASREAKTKLESNSLGDKALKGGSSFLAFHRKLPSFIRQMSGLKENSSLWNSLVRNMNAAYDAEATRNEKAAQRSSEIYDGIDKKKLTRKLFVPEINASMTLEGRLAVALNWGNEDGRQRIMDGDKWTAPQVQAILNTLTKEELAFVSNVWDHVDSYWGDIAAKEKRVYGVAPGKVEASGFTVHTPDGEVQMPGGYYPLKYDPDRSAKAEEHQLTDIIKQQMQGAATRATTRRGHTKARVDKVDRAVRKDLGVYFEHLNNVIHDLSFHEYLIDANRLMRAGPIDGAIRDYYGPQVLRALTSTLNDVAAGGIPAANMAEAGFNYLRTGSTTAGLGFNLVTSILQPFGLLNSVSRIGPRWVAQGVGQWLTSATGMSEGTAWVYEQSEFMRLRAKTNQREVNEIRNRVAPSLKPDKLKAVEEGYFYLIGKAQMVADMPTWLGAYAKSQAGDFTHEQSVAMADQAVRDSQGSGEFGYLAGAQRGGPMWKLWTNFFSYSNLVYNQLAETTQQTRKEGLSRLPILMADVALLYAIPTLLQTLLHSAVKDDWDKFWSDAAKDQIGGLFGMFVGFRELGGMIQTDGRSGGLPAGASILKAASDLYTQSERGEVDEAWLRAANRVAGPVFHYPAVQVDRTLRGMKALADGSTHNPLALLVGPPTQK